jgi:hypothetical protein
VIARIGLMELAVREGNEPLFESYRRKLLNSEIHATSRTDFLCDAGRGLARFGRFREASTTLAEALELAESTGQNQRVFEIEEAIAAAKREERQKVRQDANRPEPVSAPDDIATALDELLAEVAERAA